MEATLEGSALDKDTYKIQLPRNLNEQTLEDFKTKIKSWLLEKNTLFILDFSETYQVSKECITEVILFSKTLKSNKKTLASLNLNRRILAEVNEKGLELSFNPVKDIAEAKKIAGIKIEKKVQSANADFISTFIKAAQNALQVQACTKTQLAKKPYIQKEKENKNIAIAGVINLSSSQFNGSISLCFEKATFLKIYENMVDEVCEEIDEDIQDAAGELLNIIYGQAKAILVNEKGYDLKPAIPNVLVGDSLRIQYHTSSQVMIMPFSSDAGNFHIEIVLDSQSSEKAA